MRLVVVGSGIAGLAAAWTAHRAGLDVVVLERDERLGGKIRTIRRDGFLFEAGPDAFVTSKPHALMLCRALGLEAEIVRPRPGRAYVWGRGSLHPIPAGTRLLPTRLGPLVASGLLTPAEKARAALDLVLPGGAPEGDESLAGLVRRRMGQAVVDRLAAPLLAGVHAADPERLSVEASFPDLLAAERAHGSLMRGLRVRRGGGSAAGGSPFATLAGGLERLVERLVDAMPRAEIRRGADVARLERTDRGWTVATADGEGVEADALVLAVPARVAAPLLAPVAPRAAALLGAVEWVSTAVVTLGYREAEIPPLEGHGFVVARDQPAAISGSTWVSSKWEGRVPAGAACIRVYLGDATRPVDLGADDGVLVGLAQGDLARALGLAAEPILVDVQRWPASMPQLVVGHLTRLAAAERELAKMPRIAVAGGGYRGVGIADSVAHGIAAAEAVTGTGPEGFLQRVESTGF